MLYWCRCEERVAVAGLHPEFAPLNTAALTPRLRARAANAGAGEDSHSVSHKVGRRPSGSAQRPASQRNEFSAPDRSRPVTSAHI